MYSLLVLTSMSWPLYFERFVSRSCTEASFCLRAFCEASSAARAASRCRRSWREAVLDLLAEAGDLGELGLDALELGFGVVEADELLEVWVHGREEGDGGTVERHSTPAGGRGGGVGLEGLEPSTSRL